MGVMRYMILGLLLGGPLSLYDVQQRFAAGLGHFYSASSGSIERALRALADDALATVADDAASPRRRKLYRITDAGVAAWRDWMHAPLMRGADAETTALAKVFLLGRLDDAAQRRAVLATIRAEAEEGRAGLRRTAAELDAFGAGLASSARGLFDPQRATLDYGIRTHDLLIAWLGELEAAQ